MDPWDFCHSFESCGSVVGCKDNCPNEDFLFALCSHINVNVPESVGVFHWVKFLYSAVVFLVDERHEGVSSMMLRVILRTGCIPKGLSTMCMWFAPIFVNLSIVTSIIHMTRGSLSHRTSLLRSIWVKVTIYILGWDIWFWEMAVIWETPRFSDGANLWLSLATFTDIFGTFYESWLH